MDSVDSLQNDSFPLTAVLFPSKVEITSVKIDGTLKRPDSKLRLSQLELKTDIRKILQQNKSGVILKEDLKGHNNAERVSDLSNNNLLNVQPDDNGQGMLDSSVNSSSSGFEHMEEQITEDLVNSSLRNFMLSKWMNSIIVSPRSCKLFRRANLDISQRALLAEDYITGSKTIFVGSKKLVVINLGYHELKNDFKSPNGDIDVTNISVFVDSCTHDKANSMNTPNNSPKSSERRLRFPISRNCKQFISENEFVYVLDRAVIPVLKQIEPDFVILNIDTGCLLDKYRELFSLNSIIINHLLLELKLAIASSFIVVIGETENQAIMKTLLLDTADILSNDINSPKLETLKIECQHLKKNSVPTEMFITNHRTIIDHWGKLYPNLSSKELLEMDRQMQAAVEKERYLAGGHQEKLEINGDFLFKIVKNNELIFYRDKYPILQQIHCLLPRVYEIIHKNSEFIIKFDNLVKNGDFNMMDIKLTNDKNKQHVAPDFYNKYYFYIPGYVIKDPSGVVIEKRQKFSKRVSEKQMFDIFKRFFGSCNPEIIEIKVKKVLDFLEHSYKLAEEHNLNWAHASYLILYDQNTGKIKVRLIDMTYFDCGLKDQTLRSIKGIMTFLENFVGAVGTK